MPREISLVSWLGRLSRALRKRALLATTVIDLLSVESSACDARRMRGVHEHVSTIKRVKFITVGIVISLLVP